MAKQPANAPGRSAKRGFLVLWASVIVLSLFILALPTIVLLVCGIMPTFVAFIIDRQPERYSTLCVASMNFCGVFPYMLDLWIGTHTLIAAVHTLTDIFALFVIFGTAAFGWIVFTFVPPVISSFMGVITQHRVAVLRDEQKKLADEWGKAVGNKVENKQSGGTGTKETGGQGPDDKPAQPDGGENTASTPPSETKQAVNP